MKRGNWTLEKLSNLPTIGGQFQFRSWSHSFCLTVTCNSSFLLFHLRMSTRDTPREANGFPRVMFCVHHQLISLMTLCHNNTYSVNTYGQSKDLYRSKELREHKTECFLLEALLFVELTHENPPSYKHPTFQGLPFPDSRCISPTIMLWSIEQIHFRGMSSHSQSGLGTRRPSTQDLYNTDLEEWTT